MIQTKKCSPCRGTGIRNGGPVTRRHHAGGGAIFNFPRCPACTGSGRVQVHPPICDCPFHAQPASLAPRTTPATATIEAIQEQTPVAQAPPVDWSGWFL